MRFRTLSLLLPACLLAGCGITGNFRHDPGYVSLAPLEPLAADRSLALSLGPLPLKLAPLVLDEEDEAELGPLLRKLRAVRVYEFENVRDPERLAARVEELRVGLRRAGWLPVIHLREDGETTSVLLRPGRGQANRGLAVLLHEHDEFTLVNLIGDVRLDFFDDYMTGIDVDVTPLEIDPATLEARVVTRADPASGTGP